MTARRIVLFGAVIGGAFLVQAAGQSVTVTPVRIMNPVARSITIDVQFPVGLESITGLSATYDGLDVLDFLLPFVTEVTDTSGRIEIPPLSFPHDTEATFTFSIETTEGGATDSLLIRVPSEEVVLGYSVSNGEDGSNALYSIDLSTGAATRIGVIDLAPSDSPDVRGLALDADGVLYGGQ